MSATDRWILLLNVAATGMMIGVIWIIQIVHYPLFSLVGRDGFGAYQAAHGQRITWVVGPTMLLELATAAYLALRTPPGLPRGVMWAGLALVGVIWASTALLQVPQHTRLAAGFDPEAHRLLVWSNWVRTAAWCARGFLMLGVLARLLR
jgi:hypothetical protein